MENGIDATVGIGFKGRHNGRDGVSNQQPHHCLLNRLFWRRSKKTSKLRVTGLCAGNSLVTCEFQAQMASNTENVSIWWRHHGLHIGPDILNIKFPKIMFNTVEGVLTRLPNGHTFVQPTRQQWYYRLSVYRDTI